MNGSLINVLLPVLLIAAVALTIYALVLFIRSVLKKSKELRAKSLRIAAIPLLYIVCMLLYFVYINNHDKSITRQLPGTYLYKLSDSIRFQAVIKPNHVYELSAGGDVLTGHWRLVSNTETVLFYDQTGKEFTHSTLASDSGRICLPFFFNKQQIKLVKQ